MSRAARAAVPAVFFILIGAFMGLVWLEALLPAQPGDNLTIAEPLGGE